MQKRPIKIVVPGKSGTGKTTLALTLPENSVYFLSMEAGTLSIDAEFQGVMNNVRSFINDPDGEYNSFMDNIVWIFGPDKTRLPKEYLSNDHYLRVVAHRGGTFEEIHPGIETIFIDSLTEMSRLAYKHASRFEGAFNAKGKKDGFAVFGELKDTMMASLLHARDDRRYNVVFVAILEDVKEGISLASRIQMDGSAVGREIPGLVDEVIPLVKYVADDGMEYRILVTKQIDSLNGFIPKDRSGALGDFEPADLNAVFEKIWAGQRRPRVTTLPPELVG